jgi:glycosyltransferase involved in cell wall biosynthesis
VLSYNRLADVSTNLPPLIKFCDTEGHQLIVVDNGSTDGSIEEITRLSAQSPRTTAVFNKENLGPCGGRNVGFQLAEADYIVCFDDDATMDLEQLKTIPSLFEKYPEAGILTFRVRDPGTNLWECNHGDEPCLVANFHEAGAAYRREVFVRAGYMDPECTYGADGLDMSIRAHAVGYVTQYLPHIIVTHNKLIRSVRIEADRRLKLVYCNVRVLNKLFPSRMAAACSWRVLLRYAVPDICRRDFALAGQLVKEAQRAAIAGKKVYQALPKSTLDFYHNPKLRPDFGNTPVIANYIELQKLKKENSLWVLRQASKQK